MIRIGILLWLSTALLACELVADFDRSHIPARNGVLTDAGQAGDAGRDSVATSDREPATADAGSDAEPNY